MKLSLCSILLASLSHSVFCNASGDQHESSLERILTQQHKIQRNRSYTKTHDGRQLALQKGIDVVTTNAPDGRTRHLATGEITCLLWKNCIAFEDKRSHQWECSFGDRGLTNKFGGHENKVVVVEGVKDTTHFLDSNDAKSGESVLVMSEAFIEDDKIIVKDTNVVGLVEYGIHADIDEEVTGLRGSKPLKEDRRRRRLTSQSGTLNTLVVRVNTPDRQPPPAAALSEDIFQDEWCLKSQYKRCSYQQMQVQEYIPGVGSTVPTAPNAPGVVEITVASNAVGNTKEQIQSEANAKLQELLGVSNPGNIFDLVLFCMPPDLDNGAAWVAYAYVGRWDSYYNNDWCQSMSAQMHEVGHNIGLDHSGEYEGDDFTQEYGDQSDMMGFAFRSDDLPEMCFNPAKNWQLGWFVPKQLEINPSTDLTTEPTTFVLNGVVDYDPSPAGQYIVAKIADYYIGFNRKTSFNKGVLEAGDQVTVVEKLGSPESAAQSKLIGKLSVGNTYEIEITPAVKVEIKYVQNINGSDAVVEAKLTDDSVVGCPGGNAKIEVELVTDRYPGETAWGIYDAAGQFLVYKNGFSARETLFIETVEGLCRGTQYYFVIFDAYGDGICCTWGEGSFLVKYQDQILFAGGDFDNREDIPFTLPIGEGPGDPEVPPPTFNPTSPPTFNPTPVPTFNPTPVPTFNPTPAPTFNPTASPTFKPTLAPSKSPTKSPTSNDAPVLVAGNNAYMSNFAGELCDNQLVHRIYTDYGFRNLIFETRNGGWTSTINLPRPDGIPEGCTMTVRVNSHWSVNVMGQGIGWIVPRRGEIKFVKTANQWIQLSGYNYESAEFACPGEAAPPTESPTPSPTKSPTLSPTSGVYVVSGNNAYLNTVAGESCENDFLENIFASHRSVRIEIRNGGWTGTINVPNAERIAEGSVLTVDRKSAWPVSVFTPEAGWTLTPGSEIAFEVENGAWRQISGFELQADETTCPSTSPAPSYPRGKKGICFTLRNSWENGSYVENLPKIEALNPSWAYSWGPAPPPEVPTNTLEGGGLELRNGENGEGIDFVPMLWGYYENLFEDFTDQMLEPDPRMVFGFNEPDSTSQSNLSVEKALEGWERLASKVTSRRGDETILVSPSCVHPTGDWCRNFMSQADERNLRVDAIGFHWYGGASAQTLIDKLTETYELYGGRPIVITEFAVADWEAGTVGENRFTPDQIMAFMVEILPWLEQTEWILSYAWFSFETDSPAGWSSALVESSSGGEGGEVALTPLGQYYSDFTGNFLGVDNIYA